VFVCLCVYVFVCLCVCVFVCFVFVFSLAEKCRHGPVCALHRRDGLWVVLLLLLLFSRLAHKLVGDPVAKELGGIVAVMANTTHEPEGSCALLDEELIRPALAELHELHHLADVVVLCAL